MKPLNRETMSPIYLDHAAATPIRSEVAQAMDPYLREEFGNPSSITAGGVRAARAVRAARETIANLIGAHPDEIIFTGSGTESTNLAIRGIPEAIQTPSHLIVTAVEHHAVLEPAQDLARRGYGLTVLPMKPDGMVNLGTLEAAILPTTRLISIIWANNEIGTIQPMAQISRWLKRQNQRRQALDLPRIFLHTDACQAAGYLEIDLGKLLVDALSLNAAKIGGPKGVGLLYLRRGTPLHSQILGGGQENSRRSGTENVPGIVGLATALEFATRHRARELTRLKRLRDRMLLELAQAVPAIRINGHPTDRLPNHLSLTIPGIEAEPLVLYLDVDGVTIGTGAACSSTNLEPSHVLTALGLTRDEALETIRITLGWSTRARDVTAATGRIIRRLRWFQKHGMAGP